MAGSACSRRRPKASRPACAGATATVIAARGGRLPACAQPAAMLGHGERSRARAGRLAEHDAGLPQRPRPRIRMRSGLTTAYAGIAETGTLMLLSGPQTPTTLAFLPETSLVVLSVERIVRAYEDGFALLREETRRPAALDQFHHRPLALGRHRADLAARRPRPAPPVRSAGRRAARQPQVVP